MSLGCVQISILSSIFYLQLSTTCSVASGNIQSVLVAPLSPIQVSLSSLQHEYPLIAVNWNLKLCNTGPDTNHIRGIAVTYFFSSDPQIFT